MERRRKANLFGYCALGYAAGLLVFCKLIPHWGQWYSASPYHRLQSEAILHGHLALSTTPTDLRTDLCWSQGGIHQVWGLGIPLCRLLFDAVANLFGAPGFPDRILLGLFMALTAYVVFFTWLAPADSAREISAPQSAREAFGPVILSLFFSPTINLLRTRMDHYYEVLAYVIFFATLLICGIVSITRNPTWRKFWWLASLAGFGGLIRPTLIFYGFVTLCVSGLLVWHYEREKQLLTGAQSSSAAQLGKLGFGILLFTLGGAMLFATNYLRFGNGWEFGHKLTVSRTLPSISSTRFDYPFKHLPLTISGPELFGALFATEKFSGDDYYSGKVVAGQSSTIRARKFNYFIYDLSYAIAVFAAWLVGAWISLKWFRRHLRLLRQERKSPDLPSIPVVLTLWSMLAFLPVMVLYLRTHAIGDRYMLDFAPAFSAALISLWLFVTRASVARSRYPQLTLSYFYVLLISWQVYEITIASKAIPQKIGWGPPGSITMKESASSGFSLKPLSKPFPAEYLSRSTASAWRIPFNGEGWAPDGKTGCCGIFFADDPHFLDLTMTLAPERDPTQAPLAEIKAKVGLEQLKLVSIIHTNDTWTMHFSGPREERYQKGVQPVFVAFAPSEELGTFVTTPTPWILKRISWR